ncbi:hypothetical protein WMY93_032666 [Mugilogobius chulae]|uniref:CCHC-type domain-containing protein n=1 Tax=Mugilogobius chulae TaxID=88201 RepID=A0AAW0MKM8_9GOBI
MPIVFSGDPITYIEWKASFNSLVDCKGIAPADKLHLLKRYITGPALKCLEGTFYRSDEDAYKDAWKRLDQRYGQPFVVQKAFRDKLSKWPKIHPKDAEGLRTFADFLTACLQAMPHVKGLQILNDCEENQKLLQKVPEWLATRWNRHVTVALMDGKDFPSFKDFAEFVAVEAEISCNPVTSSHALHACGLSLEKGHTKEIKQNRPTFQVFSTQASIHTDKAPCMFCKDERHQLTMCPSFSEKSLNDKRTFVKDNRLCYGCLKIGHNAKDCRQRLTCDTCKGRHPTCLHSENHNTNEKIQCPTNTEPPTENEATAATALNVTKLGQSCSATSMIVPVWVSSVQSPSEEHLVYALLDTQSDNTFVSERLSNQLQVNSHPVNLKLTTMLGAPTMVKSRKVSGLRVRGYTSVIKIDLPTSYTKDNIPFNYDNIPTNETAKQWPHLSEIVDIMPPLLSCEVGLLIGFNCSRTLAPKQVLLGNDGEPFAIQTDVGWSIVGGSTSGQMESLCHRATMRELSPLKVSDVINATESTVNNTKASNKKESKKDLICKLKEGTRKKEQGNSEMALPFKPQMPYKEKLAEFRQEHLKQKFHKENKNKRDYKEHNERTQNEQRHMSHSKQTPMTCVSVLRPVSLSSDLVSVLRPVSLSSDLCLCPQTCLCPQLLSSDLCLCPQTCVSVLRPVSLSSDLCLCPRPVSLSSDLCLCPRTCVSVLGPVSLSSDLCLCPRTCVSVLRPVSLSSDLCLCPQTCVSVLRPVSLSSGLCLCPQTCVSVLRPVSLSSDLCLCPQTCVSVLRPVSLSSDLCLCPQTCVSVLRPVERL